MLDERQLAGRRDAIEARLDAALDAPADDELALSRGAVMDRDDRWYGQLLAVAYDAVAGRRAEAGESSRRQPDEASFGGLDAADSVVHAAASVELLRGYCRLRSELLVQLSDGVAPSLSRDPASALLAADYLYASAYSTLGVGDRNDLGVDDENSLGACFETLTEVSETIIEAFSTKHTEATGPPPQTDRYSFIDSVAGALGEGAAVIGSTLAGADDDQRRRVSAFGRAFATARQVRLVAGSADRTVFTVPPVSDTEKLREYESRAIADGERALDELPDVVDGALLSSFVSTTLS